MTPNFKLLINNMETQTEISSRQAGKTVEKRGKIKRAYVKYESESILNRSFYTLTAQHFTICETDYACFTLLFYYELKYFMGWRYQILWISNFRLQLIYPI